MTKRKSTKEQTIRCPGRQAVPAPLVAPVVLI